MTVTGRPIRGGGPDLADEVGEAVDGDRLGRRSAQDREHGAVGHPLGEGLLELLEPDGVAFQVALHQGVVGDDDALDQGVVHLVFGRGQVRGDRPLAPACPSRR